MAGIQQKDNSLFKQGILKQDSQHKVLKQDHSENSLEQECLVDERSDETTSVYENINISASTLNVENGGRCSKFGFRHLILMMIP